MIKHRQFTENLKTGYIMLVIYTHFYFYYFKILFFKVLVNLKEAKKKQGGEDKCMWKILQSI